MMQPASSDTSLRGEELRYVTEHFRELQGLRQAPLWPGALLATILIPWFSLSSLRALETLTVCCIALAGWIPWSGAWYRRHYGTIVNPARRPVPYLGAAMFVFAMIYIGSGLFSTLDRYRGAFKLWYVLIFTLPACFYIVPPSARIRLRRALYIAGTVIVFFLVGSVPFLHPSKWLLLYTVLSTLSILSLYDHWLFHHFLHDGASGVSSD